MVRNGQNFAYVIYVRYLSDMNGRSPTLDISQQAATMAMGKSMTSLTEVVTEESNLVLIGELVTSSSYVGSKVV